MISHEHKCIFIHISKCAGSSIESAFGIDITDNSENNNPNLFGWNQKHKLFLQHATPQELLDKNFISKEIWDSYFKFIVVRNPFDRALSDYLWMMRDLNVEDTFENYLTMDGNFAIMKDKNNIATYRADHLTQQKDYFFLNGREISFDLILKFENIQKDLKTLIQHLNLSPDFFNTRINISKKKYGHYSHFYTKERGELVEKKYMEDLIFLGYDFREKNKFILKIKSLRKRQ